jgi:hypothetical protein
MTTSDEAIPGEPDPGRVQTGTPERRSARKLVSSRRGHAAVIATLIVLFGVVLVWRLFDRDEINLKVTPSRPGERCDGDLIDERPYGQEGEVLAISRVRYDASTGRACAKFTKAENSALYNVTSYVAVELCNDQGECDKDKNFYAREAGPVRVSSGPLGLPNPARSASERESPAVPS